VMTRYLIQDHRFLDSQRGVSNEPSRNEEYARPGLESISILGSSVAARVFRLSHDQRCASACWQTPAGIDGSNPAPLRWGVTGIAVASVHPLVGASCRQQGVAQPVLARGSLGRALIRFFVLLALDNLDPELGEYRHRVPDLLRGRLVRRQRAVQLVIG
jgi:hypothetical protein